MGCVVADYKDYFIAYQLVGDSFRESLGEGQRYTDDRMRIIDKVGVITPRALSEKFSVSTAAISQWLKPLIDKGVLNWCDEKGDGFIDFAELEKAKRSGKAYLTVSERCCLPTVSQLTGDSRWDTGGEYWELYDLGIGESHQDEKDDGVYVNNDSDAHAEKLSETSTSGGGVKVLSEKTESVDNFRDDRLDSELIPVSIDGLSEEFGKLLQMN
jgi:hypothetical protein